MKQTLYEKIRTVVESGNIAITQYKDGSYILWSSNAGTGCVRRSIDELDVEECFLTLGTTLNSKKFIDEFEKDGMCYIGIYDRPLWRPKVGDKVQILERINQVYTEYTNIEDWQNCEVINVDISDCQIRGDKGILIGVPYDCIAPRVEVDEI